MEPHCLHPPRGASAQKRPRCDTLPPRNPVKTRTRCRLAMMKSLLLRIDVSWSVTYLLLLLCVAVPVLVVTQVYVTRMLLSSWHAVHNARVYYITERISISTASVRDIANGFMALNIPGRYKGRDSRLLQRLCSSLDHYDKMALFRALSLVSLTDENVTSCVHGIPIMDSIHTLTGYFARDHIINGSYLIDNETYDFVQPLQMVEEWPESARNISALMKTTYSGKPIFELLPAYLNGTMDSIDPRHHWIFPSATPHLLCYVLPLGYIVRSHANISSVHYTDFTQVQLDGSRMLMDNFVEAPGFVMAIFIHQSLADDDPLVLSNSWGQPSVSNDSVYSIFGTAPVTYLKVSSISDPLMRAALKYVDLAALQLQGYRRTVDFEYSGAAAVVTAHSYTTGQGLVVPIVLASSHAAITAPYLRLRRILNAIVAVVILLLTVAFFGIARRLISQPLRRMTAFILTSLRAGRRAVFYTNRYTVLQLTEVHALIQAHKAAMKQLREIYAFVPDELRVGDSTRRINSSVSNTASSTDIPTSRKATKLGSRSLVTHLSTAVFLNIRSPAPRAGSQPVAPITALPPPPSAEHGSQHRQQRPLPHTGRTHRIPHRRAGAVPHAPRHAASRLPRRVRAALPQRRARTPAAWTGSSESGGCAHHEARRPCRTAGTAAAGPRAAGGDVAPRRARRTPRRCLRAGPGELGGRTERQRRQCAGRRCVAHAGRARAAGHEPVHVRAVLPRRQRADAAGGAWPRRAARAGPRAAAHRRARGRDGGDGDAAARGGAPQEPRLRHRGPRRAADPRGCAAHGPRGAGQRGGGTVRGAARARGGRRGVAAVRALLLRWLRAHAARRLRRRAERLPRRRRDRGPGARASAAEHATGGAVSEQLGRLVRECEHRVRWRITEPLCKARLCPLGIDAVLRDTKPPGSETGAQCQRAPLHAEGDAGVPQKVRPREEKCTGPSLTSRQRFPDVRERYVLAMPDGISTFRSVVPSMPAWIRDQHGLQWHLARRRGDIESTPVSMWQKRVLALGSAGALCSVSYLMYREVHPVVAKAIRDAPLGPMSDTLRSATPIFVPSSCQEAAARRLFEKHQQLRHPNLLLCLGFSESIEGGMMSIWEFSPGGTLRELIFRYPRVKAVTINRFGLHALTALSYLHERGIAHGGVCLDNVLVSADGKCRLTGHSGDRKAACELFYVHQTCYISPRMATGALPTPQCDMFCFGLSTIEALTKEPCWKWATCEDGKSFGTSAELAELMKAGGKP
ncbi:Protein kinase domain/Protein tyrosine kinase, putative, partial [Leishmania shawi]